MRKIYFIILLNIIFIFHVDAASISTSISCPNTVYKDDSFTCTIGSSVIDANLSGIKGNYVITNGSYVSFTPSSSFVAYASNEQGFVIGNTSGGVKGGTLGTLQIKANGEVDTSITVRITNVNASDTDYNDYDLSDMVSTIKIIKKEEPKPDPTPEPKPEPTPEPSNPTKEEDTKKEAYLDTLEVEGYKIDFLKNVYSYTIEVPEDVKTITIKATSSYKIKGTGTVKLDKDSNIFEVVVDNKTVYKIIVNKIRKSTNKVNNDINEIKKALEDYKEIVIDLDINTNELIAYKNILEEIYKKYKTITYNIYDKNKLLYSYVFNGIDMDYILDNINLQINYDIDNKDINKEYAKKGLLFQTLYKSYYPNNTILKIYNVKGNNINLYKINSEGSTELIKSNIKITDETVAITLEKGDMYLLSNLSKNKDTKYETISIILTFLVIAVGLELGYVTYKYVSLRKETTNK